MNQKSAFHVKDNRDRGYLYSIPILIFQKITLLRMVLSVLKVIESKRQCLVLRLVSFINHMIISCIYILSVCFL